MRLRTLQFRDEQYMLNVPKKVVESLKWKTGDKIEVIIKENATIELRKAGGRDVSKNTLMLPYDENRAVQSLNHLFIRGKVMDPLTFAHYLSQLQHYLAKWRRRREEFER